MVSFPDLKGKSVLVTGGASGIGLAIAREFGREGAKLFLVDISAANLKHAVASLKADGVEAVSHVASVTESDEVAEAFNKCDEKFGGINTLINNAGISGHIPTLEITDQQWKTILDINLTGMFNSAREAGRRMCAQGSGVIVNTSSMYGLVAAPERLGYGVTKSGAAMMTKNLAIEWADKGVRVNAIAPGYIQTALVEDLLAKGSYDLQSLQKRTPMGRLGTLQEVADAAVFLTSNRASFITGQVLTIDGGWSSYGYI